MIPSRLDPRQWSLQTKLPLTVVAIVYSVALVAGVIAQLWETRVVRDALEDRARQLALSLAASNAEHVARMDYWVLYVNLRRQVEALDQSMAPLLFGSIVNDQGSVLAHTHPDRQRIGEPLAEVSAFDGMYPGQGTVSRQGRYGGREALLISVPVEYRGKDVGYIWLGYDTDFIRSRVLTTVMQIGAAATILALIGSLFGWMLSRRMTRPISELTSTVERIRGGRLDEIAPVRPHENDEIGRLVTAFNEMAAQLKEKEALSQQLRVSERLAALGRMVSGIAHEINNPLGGMKNALENLRQFADDPARREQSMHLLTSGLNQIGSVVEVLLTQHRGAGVIGTCDPRCLDDLFLLLRHDCELRGIRIHWRNTITHAFIVRQTQLQQILTNLLVNAVQAMPGGGELFFDAGERGDRLYFVVSDTGPGMPQDQLERIFEPFFTTRPDGTGMGLWISLGLVEAMGGTLAVESEPGRGSRFTVELPSVPPAGYAESVTESTRHAGRPEASTDA